MLTRLEVNGFKNLIGFAVDFGAFTCIAGENGAGKSNVFDAIQFLSALAERSLMEAAQEVRSTRRDRTGDPRDLFWNGYQSAERRMQLAAEMIVPADVVDDFGQPAQASITFLRYEVEIGLDPPAGANRLGRMVLLSEQLRHIKLGDAKAHLGFPHSAKEWRTSVVTGRRSGIAFISTEGRDAGRIITIHQDGGSRGQPRRLSGIRAPATAVSTITGADDPTILAARREMQSWRRLALEPSALRTADSYSDHQVMEVDGSHLASALYRTAIESGDPVATYSRVAGRLASLTGLDVRKLRVEADDARELLTLELEESGQIELPARSLSEGTLRFLALCVLLEDPTIEGVLCMEEPENGINPANVPAMMDLVQDLAMDVKLPPGTDNPFRQVVVNTHSPLVVRLVSPEDLVYATTVPVKWGDGTMARALRLRPLRDTWRSHRIGETDEPAVSGADLLVYLSEPPGAQLSLSPVA